MKQTDGQLRCVKPQSRYRELRLNNIDKLPFYFILQALLINSRRGLTQSATATMVNSFIIEAGLLQQHFVKIDELQRCAAQVVWRQ